MHPGYAVLMTLLCSCLGSIAWAQPRPAPPEIWFTPLQDSRNPAGRGIVFDQHDFPAFVASRGPWQQAASHISVLKLNVTGLVVAYPDLASVIGMIDHSNFRIASSGPFVHSDHRCEVLREGMSNDVGYERMIVSTWHKWKLAGGRLDYAIMDGALGFGHYATQQQCHFTIEDAARSAAGTFLMVQRDFPDVKVAAAEGPGWIPLDRWLPDLDQFLQAFKAAAGKPIENVSLDMHWADPRPLARDYDWVAATRRSAEYLRARGVKVGLIVNADDRFVEQGGHIIRGQPITEQAWMQMNREHLRTIHDARLPLDYIVINSWMRFPQHNLPESDPNALASLVDFASQLWSR